SERIPGRRRLPINWSIWQPFVNDMAAAAMLASALLVFHLTERTMRGRQWRRLWLSYKHRSKAWQCSIRHKSVVDLGLHFTEEGKLRNVIEDDEDGKDDDADESNLVDALFELLIDVASNDAFNDEEKNHAAIENGNGQK